MTTPSPTAAFADYVTFARHLIRENRPDAACWALRRALGEANRLRNPAVASHTMRALNLARRVQPNAGASR